MLEESKEEKEEEGEENGIGDPVTSKLDKDLIQKVLEQEPEMLYHAYASPLSPQLSSLGTLRLGPSIKVWYHNNVLALPPPILLSPSGFSRSFSLNSNSNAIDDDRFMTKVFLISHGECELNLRPDLISGRYPQVALNPNEKRQARALAVFLHSQRVSFNVVYSSPIMILVILVKRRRPSCSVGWLASMKIKLLGFQVQFCDEGFSL